MVKILNSIWWREEIKRNRKYRNLNTIVKSILTYGCEAWKMTEKEKKGNAAVEMDALRRFYGISRKDKMRNEMIKRRIKIIETIEKEMQRRQLFWYGYVRRKDEKKIPIMAMEYRPTCKKEKRKIKKNMI